jgi:hypothetical protein
MKISHSLGFWDETACIAEPNWFHDSDLTFISGIP